MSRRLPLLVFLGLALVLTLVFLAQPEPEVPAAVEGGPLVQLAPHIRRLEDGPDGELSARTFVEATMDTVAGSPRAVVLEALQAPDWAARYAGLLAVPRYGPPDGALAEALEPLLGDPSARVRRTAATACGFLGVEFAQVEEALAKAATDEAADVRTEAMATLAKRTTDAAGRLSLFRDGLRDDTSAVRAAAAKGLARIELQERLPVEAQAPLGVALARALDDDAPDVRMYAAMALGRLGPAAAPHVPALVARLDDGSTLVRGTVANALGEVGAPAVPAIAAALDGATPAKAASLLWSLRVIGAAGLPVLRTALAHDAASVRVQAALKLWELEEPIEASLRVLGEVLDGSDAEARRLAARGFARMGTAGATARSVLARHSDDADPAVRDAVRSALARIDAAPPKGQK